MIEIIIWGRGGHGAVLAALILADAVARKEGVFSQAFPFFGSERRGAPVESYVRIDQKIIRLKCQIKKADILIVFSEGLLDSKKTEDYLKDGGLLLINSKKKPSDFAFSRTFKVITFDAVSLAKKWGLGKKIPIVNTIMLGVFAKETDLVSFENLLKAVEFNLTGEKEKNIGAIKEVRQNGG